MASAVRFKTYAEMVDDVREVVKGQTTIKVVTSKGEEQVQVAFADENTGEFVMVCKDLISDDVDADDPEELTEWRTALNGAAPTKAKRGSKTKATTKTKAARGSKAIAAKSKTSTKSATKAKARPSASRKKVRRPKR